MVLKANVSYLKFTLFYLLTNNGIVQIDNQLNPHNAGS